jgi:hypothetical protein
VSVETISGLVAAVAAVGAVWFAREARVESAFHPIVVTNNRAAGDPIGPGAGLSYQL